MCLVIIYSCKIIFLWMKTRAGFNSEPMYRLYQQALITAGQSANLYRKVSQNSTTLDVN